MFAFNTNIHEVFKSLIYNLFTVLFFTKHELKRDNTLSQVVLIHVHVRLIYSLVMLLFSRNWFLRVYFTYIYMNYKNQNTVKLN